MTDIRKYIGGNCEQNALMDWRKDRLLDVKVLKEAGGGIFDHFLVVTKVKIWCGLMKRSKENKRNKKSQITWIRMNVGGIT